MLTWFIPLGTFTYAIIRYGLVMGYPLENWPSYIGNKGLAFSATLLFLAAAVMRLSNQPRSVELFRASLFFAIAHVALSATLMHAVYYKYLFADTGKLNAYGETAFFFGALAIATFLTHRGQPATRYALPALAGLLLAHATAVGYLKWIDVSRWQQGLPPISLMCALALAVAFVVLLRRPRTTQSTTVTTQQH